MFTTSCLCWLSSRGLIQVCSVIRRLVCSFASLPIRDVLSSLWSCECNLNDCFMASMLFTSLLEAWKLRDQVRTVFGFKWFQLCHNVCHNAWRLSLWQYQTIYHWISQHCGVWHVHLSGNENSGDLCGWETEYTISDIIEMTCCKEYNVEASSPLLWLENARANLLHVQLGSSTLCPLSIFSATPNVDSRTSTSPCSSIGLPHIAYE